MNYIHWLKARKNIKMVYYLKCYGRQLMPDFLCRLSLNKWVKRYEQSSEKAYLDDRIDYYCKRRDTFDLPETSTRIADLKLKRAKFKVYFFDAIEITRYFSKTLKLNWLFGDVIHVPEVPSIVKSRPIEGDNRNSVVLKLEKQRHFVFLDDPYSFSEKDNRVIFRGKVLGKSHRERFLELYIDHPMCDLADVARNARPEWQKEKMTLLEHLRFKFIMALEGNDVASNLKWVMSSNSIAVMPRPTYETWFMEGRLIPNVHYIEIRPDYADLEERLNYYIEHPDEAQQIIDNAHQYVEQFMNSRRERLLSIMVLKRYFDTTR